MAKILVKPSQLKGTLGLPPSKSHTLRALLFAMMAEGTSKIRNILTSPDTDAMIKTIRSFGAEVDIKDSTATIKGICGKKLYSNSVIDCNNSGIALRFFTALSALAHNSVVITGDNSIQHNRPIKALVDALNILGVKCKYLNKQGFAPLRITGPVLGHKTTVLGQDSQFVSALIILGALCDHEVEINVINPGEIPWIYLTLSWLDFLKIPYRKNHDFTSFKLFGQAKIKGFEYTVPSDLSSACFPIAAALITRSDLTLTNIDLKDVQGDKKIINLLQDMGAVFEYDSIQNRLKISKKSILRGQSIDVNDCIDGICILSVIGCFAQGETILYNAEIARTKECDRIKAMASELKKMGADIKETPDGLIIKHSDLTSAKVSSYDDHRVILSLAVAGLNTKNGQTVIENTEAIAKTYKNFVSDMSLVNAQIKEFI